MRTINDGGPAFPRAAYEGQRTAHTGHSGMSLRDHFAGLVMLAELQTAGSSKMPAEALRAAATRAGRTIEQQIAWNSYQMADAMLAERAKVRP